MSKSVKFVEITGLRSQYGGSGSGEAINRHSTRTYIMHINGKDFGWALHVDRNQDTLPKSFTVSEFGYSSDQGVVEGKKFKGNSPVFHEEVKLDIIEKCSTWPQIENVLIEVVKSLEDSPLDNDSEFSIERANEEQNFFHLHGAIK